MNQLSHHAPRWQDSLNRIGRLKFKKMILNHFCFAEIGSCDETPCEDGEQCAQIDWFHYRCFSKYQDVLSSVRTLKVFHKGEEKCNKKFRQPGRRITSRSKGIIRTAVPLPCQKAAQDPLGVSRAADPEEMMSCRTQRRNLFVYSYICPNL